MYTVTLLEERFPVSFCPVSLCWPVQILVKQKQIIGRSHSNKQTINTQYMYMKMHWVRTVYCILFSPVFWTPYPWQLLFVEILDFLHRVQSDVQKLQVRLTVFSLYFTDLKSREGNAEKLKTLTKLISLRY